MTIESVEKDDQIKPIKWLPICIIAIVLYLVFLVISLPASVVVNMADKQKLIPENVSLINVSGSIWQGQASQLVVDGMLVNNVHWQLKPISLFMGKASLVVFAGNARNKGDISFSGELELSADTFHAEKLKVRLPASLIANQVSLPVKAHLNGRFILDLEAVSFANIQSKQPQCELLTGDVLWNQASAEVYNQTIQLDKVAGQLQCDSTNPALKINGDNKLGLDLLAVFDAQQGVKLNGFVKPDSSMPKTVHDAMAYLGQPNTQGQYKIEW